MSLAESLLQGARPVAPSVHLRSKSSMMSLIKEEPRLPASEPEVSRLLGYRLGRHACSGQVREGCAAFGHLAELATRRRSPLRPAAPQEALSSPSSLPGRSFVPAERCKPPYSCEWLFAHRAHCGGSPLRPTALHSYSAELRSPSASAVLADAARVVTTHPQRASATAAAGEAGAAHDAAKPLPEDDTTPDSVYALLTPLEVET